MNYLKNKIIIFSINILNKLGKGFIIKKNVFSCRNILEKNFPINQNFNFIQIGANDGVSFDFLYDFVVKRKSSGLVIEPIKDYFIELEKNYINFPEIKKINKAIHPFEKEVTMSRINPKTMHKYPDWVKGIASLNANHHKKTGIDVNDMLKQTVEADDLMNIIKANYDNKKVNYFQVDTEGFDYEILKTLDLNYCKPEIIKYEVVNLNENEKNKLELMLKAKGFFLFKESVDMIAINLNKIKLV
jgi:FkbM family methyltransferase